MSKKVYNNIVVISDLHAGCQTALCPPKVKLDGGGVYEQNRVQVQVWKWWQEFWQWVDWTTNKEPFVLVVNGDALDGRHHNNTSTISNNLETQKKIALEILEPVCEKASEYYHIRGTEAHVGPSGEDEETLANSLGAIADMDGRKARWELNIRLGEKNGALGNIMHHIGTTGSQASESTAVMSELVDAYCEAGRRGEEAPDWVIRSHRHRFISVKIATDRGRAYSATTPAWQGKTPYVMRLRGARQTQPQFGGIVMREAPDGVWFLTEKVFQPKRGKV